MGMIADMGFDESKIQMLRQVYRMVGKRDAGWEFDPAQIPMFVIVPLIPDYAEYLRETEAVKDAETYEALFTELAEVA